MLKNIKIKELLNTKIKIEKKQILNLIILIIFGIITFLTAYMHECWRDESQAWLLTRDVPIFHLLFSQLKYEGHPGVWYILLLPFTKLGFPFQTINFISCFVMLIAAYFIIFKSKIETMPKIALLLTTPFIYYYSVIGRSYCILSLFIILIAYVYGKREKHPYILAILLALIMNTHVLALGFVAIITFIVYIYEPIEKIIKSKQKPNKQQVIKLFIPLLIIGVAGILFLFQIKPWEHSNTVIDTDVTKFTFKEATTKIEDAIKVIVNTMVPYKNLYYVYFILIPLMFLLGIHHFRKEVIICVFGMLFQLFIYAFIIGALAHVIFVSLVMLGCYLWMIKDKAQNGTKTVKILATLIELLAFIIFICNIPISYNYIKYDLLNEYSASKQTANYINTNIEKGSNFIATSDVRAQSIIPYTNKNYHFFSLQTKNEFTYITWDNSVYNRITYKDFTDAIDKSLASNNHTYVIYDCGILTSFVQNMQLEYNTKEVYKDFNTYLDIVKETYIIYEVDSKE